MKFTKMMLFVVAAVLVSGCGYSSMNSELTGQVKYVQNQTPIFCYNYVFVDLSLGAMRGGTGSVSTQDVQLTVMTPEQADTLKKAATDGKLVKIIYNDRRFSLCQPETRIVSVEILSTN